MELPKAYDHTQVEQKIYDKWMKSGYFNPDCLPKQSALSERSESKGLIDDRQPYTIIMPPPNANAPMHIGHALFVTIEDILIRYHRMKGEKALWLPGTDHAGFETQVVFEKKLEKAGRSRFKMQREEFYKEIYEFVQGNKHITEEGLKRLGASCDWDRNIFTLDPRIIKIVYETFKQMHADGLIYRGDRIGNWCTKHQTALSDLETKYEEREDPLYYIKYGPIELATVRLETKFGDTAIAVNPKDRRYKKYLGKEIEIETLLGKTKIKVVGDEAVDMEFGTGAVKVTPAHDPVDFEIWQRHKDEIDGPKQVIDKYGRLNELAGPYKGMKVLEARKKIAEDLAARGLLDPKKTDHQYKHNVQLCYKCGNVIEPLIIPQWFVAMTKPLSSGRTSLRDMAVKAIEDGSVGYVPERFKKISLHWLNNIRDWSISRQIWWGIPIPAYYCGGVEKSSQTIMGMAGHIASEIFRGKTRTYRLRNHGIRKGDRIALENSQTRLLMGHAIITAVEKTTVEEIELPDQKHSGKYKTTEELVAAFKYLHPDKEVNRKTPVWIYDFEFQSFTANDKKIGCGQIVISDKAPEYCPACGGKNLVADPDTFDTWFSSGQWPYATLQAWGKKDFETYFPTQVMETAWDILFFWVARMIMFSYYHTGKQPFSTVFLHGLVRDRDRQKISKSKGNVIDPLGVIDLYGCDALRFALVFSTAAGNDIPLSEDKIRGMKHFGNKLWNISRFILANVDKTDWKSKIITDADKDISDKLEALKKTATEHLENYRLHEAAQEIYQFTWHEFADVYLEASKKQLQDEKLSENTKKLLLHVLINILKLLHPFMPFITEELWSKLYEAKLLGQDPMLMVSKWPKPDSSS